MRQQAWLAGCIWRSQSWDLPQAMLLEAEAGLKWRVWEENLPQLMFSGALGSLSCLWVLCGDILWLRDTGKGQDQGPDQTNQAPPSCHQGAAVGVLLRKLLFRKGKTPPILPSPLSKGMEVSPFFLSLPWLRQAQWLFRQNPLYNPPSQHRAAKIPAGVGHPGSVSGPPPRGTGPEWGVGAFPVCGSIPCAL